MLKLDQGEIVELENENLKQIEHFSRKILSFHSHDQQAFFFNENKRISLHNNRVQFPEDWVGTPTWPPFVCLGTPTWLL